MADDAPLPLPLPLPLPPPTDPEEPEEPDPLLATPDDNGVLEGRGRLLTEGDP